MSVTIQFAGMVGGVASLLTAVSGFYAQVALPVILFRFFISLLLFGGIGLLVGVYLRRQLFSHLASGYDKNDTHGADADHPIETQSLQPWETERVLPEQVNVVNRR